MFSISSIRTVRQPIRAQAGHTDKTQPKRVVRAAEGVKGKTASLLAGSQLFLASTASATELSPAIEKAADIAETGLQYAEAAVKIAGEAADVAKDLYTKAEPTLKIGAEKIAPVADSATKFASKTFTPLINDAVSAGNTAVSSSVGNVDALLKSNGVDAAPAVSAAGKAISSSPGFVKSQIPVIQQFLAQDTVIIAKYGLGAAVAYFLLPVAGSAIATLLRGYAGDIRPASALDLLVKSGGACIVDVRSPEEVASKGEIALSKGGGKQLTSVPRNALANRGAYVNADNVEAQLTALKIDALKTTKKGQPVILLDQSGNKAKKIAAELSSNGYGSVYVITGGFDQWVRDQLGTKASVKASAPKTGSQFFGRPSGPELISGGRSGTKALPGK